ncbi:non-structural maintenance of chromosomes element 1 homolog [Wyeomyia smithii]|uniref:non-structural maintenance of chromosomes element 1 homolog n=1 Tax=Wyeomyia smithii TaxID=174621 RepID=UPI002467DAC0|nr:non-structural maintenance of chromosomes element 1 homolog [Wyeomyia smithii]
MKMWHHCLRDTQLSITISIVYAVRVRNMPSEMPYTDVHRVFLQALDHHGTMSAKQAYKALLGVYGKYHDDETMPTEDAVPEVVATINGKLHRYGQRVAFVHYEPLGVDFYVFCNQTESAIDRFQTCYTESEIALFRLILREMACSEDHKLRPIVCLNLTTNIVGKSVSKMRAEELLEEWEKLGYFVQLDGMWCFGPRSTTEFGWYLNQNHGEQMHKCKLCSELVFYGIQCQKCPLSFHRECMKKYLRRLSKCPGCNELWAVPVTA